MFSIRTGSKIWLSCCYPCSTISFWFITLFSYEMIDEVNFYDVVVSRSDEKCKSTFLINLNSYFAHLMLFSSKYCLCMWVPNVWIEYTLLTVVYGLVKRLTHKTHSYKSSFMFCPNFLFILNIILRAKVSVKFIKYCYTNAFNCLMYCIYPFMTRS